MKYVNFVTFANLRMNAFRIKVVYLHKGHCDFLISPNICIVTNVLFLYKPLLKYRSM